MQSTVLCKAVISVFFFSSLAQQLCAHGPLLVITWAQVEMIQRTVSP